MLVTRDSSCRRVRAGPRYYCDASIGDRGRHLVVHAASRTWCGTTAAASHAPGTVVKMLNAAGALRVPDVISHNAVLCVMEHTGFWCFHPECGARESRTNEQWPVRVYVADANDGLLYANLRVERIWRASERE